MNCRRQHHHLESRCHLGDVDHAVQRERRELLRRIPQGLVDHHRHDVADKAKAGNAKAKEVIQSWADAGAPQVVTQPASNPGDTGSTSSEARPVKFSVLKEKVLDTAFQLDPRGWRILTLRWGAFFVFMAVLNEIVWRGFSTDVWVNVKVFGFLPMTLLFAVAQAGLIRRHAVSAENQPDLR